MGNQNTFLSTLDRLISSEQLSLPAFSPVLLRVQQELVKKDPDLQKVSKLISGDQALSGNVIKIANSAMYRGFSPVTNTKAAVVRLGLSEVGRIVFTDINQKMFRSRDPKLNILMKKLWQHSLGCAFAAGMLSQSLDFGVMQNQAFSAGLFHDIGKLIILRVIDEKKRKNKALVVPQDLVIEAMQKLHMKYGANLLQNIQLPEVFAVIARDHHHEEFDAQNYTLVLVRMANHICHAMGIGLVHNPSLLLLHQPEAKVLEVSHAELDQVQKFLETATGVFE
ncbi:HDOD domain-containing protein [Desulfogranum japonicum]|uniref:HDOD domain-containing protein n=1 Tax=Desulfogranum japonicum TaxID=231447 RepID=UPI00041D56CC|nr:HDOD domain-containing protein [Desulfogranum japonicum]